MHKRYLHTIILLAAGFVRPVHAQPPVLGPAATFVLFSSTGAVGNTGATSHFTGNIGTSGGAITMGVNVNGVLHNADATAILVNAAVLSAYNQIQGMIPTDTQLSIGSYILGNKDTLTAGVDSINVNTILTDTLVLDGQNDPNSVFIFKINGTFTSDNALSAPAVVLINGALACNVFFQVNGAVDMSAGTSMKGTLIANSSSINLGSGTTLEGRALTSTAGAITVTDAEAFVPTGCGSPVLTGPPAPLLGAAACFTLFTGVGANTNSGITTVVGDVGSNVGLTTGYDTLRVSGTIHPNPDLLTTAAAASLAGVSTYLNILGLAPDIELQFPAQFGNDLVLTPHVYLLSAATPLTGNVYLNAEGNANAVFVIKILGAMSTSVGAKVILINGTQADNVYWMINGALSIAGNADMQGNFIVETGAVDIGTGANLDGRALTTDGAFSADAVTATSPPFTCPAAIALPVKWIYFRGNRAANGVALEWATTQQGPGSVFTIEKSADGMGYERMVSVPAAAGSGTTEDRYAAADPFPFPVTHYRVALTGPDGKDTYSQTIVVRAGNAAVPQPTVHIKDGAVHLNYSSDVEGPASLSLYSMDGRRVASQGVSLVKSARIYRIECPEQSGMYLVYIEGGGVKRYAGKVFNN